MLNKGIIKHNNTLFYKMNCTRINHKGSLISQTNSDAIENLSHPEQLDFI